MIRLLKTYRLCLAGAIYFLPLASFEVGRRVWALSMSVMGRPATYPLTGHFTIVACSAVVWAFMASRYKVTSIEELFRERTGARAAWSATVSTSVILIGVLFFGRNNVLPRGFFVCGIATLLILTLLVHAIFRLFLRRNVRLRPAMRILIVGVDKFACDAAIRLQNVSFIPCDVVGYVKLPGQEVASGVTPIFELEELKDLHPGNGVDEVVLAVHPAWFSHIPKIIESFSTLSIPARAIVDLGEGIVVREKLFQIGRMQMLDLTATPAESMDYALVKRTFDIIFASLALVVLSPLLLLIALCIKITSDGPVIFVQKRVGLNGMPFNMYKFRTMKVMPTRESDLGRTAKSDPRCTSIGAILRKTSLDELPQFFNILKGNMSVVGPRPEVPHYVQEYMKDVQGYNNRHWLKVGITGWAQVNGWRGETSIQKRIEHDLYYLQNWTFSLDMRIILMTISSVLVGKNAY